MKLEHSVVIVDAEGANKAFLAFLRAYGLPKDTPMVWLFEQAIEAEKNSREEPFVDRPWLRPIQERERVFRNNFSCKHTDGSYFTINLEKVFSVEDDKLVFGRKLIRIVSRPVD